jgi:hypothetical protein
MHNLQSRQRALVLALAAIFCSSLATSGLHAQEQPQEPQGSSIQKLVDALKDAKTTELLKSGMKKLTDFISDAELKRKAPTDNPFFGYWLYKLTGEKKDGVIIRFKFSTSKWEQSALVEGSYYPVYKGTYTQSNNLAVLQAEESMDFETGAWVRISAETSAIVSGSSLTWTDSNGVKSRFAKQ